MRTPGSRTNPSPLTVISAAVAITTITGFGILVHQYGLSGAWLYIWEGDPYAGATRSALQQLEKADRRLNYQLESSITNLEVALERARLESLDGSSDGEVLALWRASLVHVTKDLRTTLSTTSHSLDKLAADIDQIIIGGEDDKLNIRGRKKAISKQVVLLMERLDALIAFHQAATSGQ